MEEGARGEEETAEDVKGHALKRKALRAEGDTSLRNLGEMLRLRYGAPLETLARIETDDDWSFVIKLHALLEAAAKALLVANLDTRLKGLAEYFALGDTENGTLTWLSALELLTDGKRNFIRFFSEIRNKAAHDIKQADFTFRKWVKTLDASKIKRYRSAVVPILGEKLLVDGRPRLTAERALEEPRTIILQCAIDVLVSVECYFF